MKSISQQVWEKYPRTKREKEGCRTEKERMKAIRIQYKKRLEYMAKETGTVKPNSGGVSIRTSTR